jgi:hypothetical protein
MMHQMDNAYAASPRLPSIYEPSEYSTDLVQDNGHLLSIQDNPVIAYLISLGSKRSRQTMSSFLSIVAKMLGAQGLHDFAWSGIRRLHVQAVLEMLCDAGRAPTTMNIYLSALKGD